MKIAREFPQTHEGDTGRVPDPDPNHRNKTGI
jgi:hypothetical protein